MTKKEEKENKLNNLKRKEWLRPLQYTATELQVVLGVGLTKIREWTAQGTLRSYPMDGGVFYHADDIDDFVQTHRDNRRFVAGNDGEGQ